MTGRVSGDVPLSVAAIDKVLMPYAEALANRLGVNLLPYAVPEPRRHDNAAVLLVFGFDGLYLQRTGKKAPGPVMVDWASGKNAHRRRQGGGELVVKAVGAARATRPLTVIDATAGLGEDALVLASHGCHVTMLERSAVMAELLADGMRRAAGDPELAPVLERMRLLGDNAVNWLRDHPEAADVVYLDPMFPERRQSAEVRKEMRICRDLVGDDADAGELLEAALGAAGHRVVVKRPRKAEALPGPSPASSVVGRSSRFDIYSRRALP